MSIPDACLRLLAASPTSGDAAFTWENLEDVAPFGLVAVIVTVSVISGVALAMVRTIERERSRRRIAELVAQNKVAPDVAVRLLEAKPGGADKDDD